jgi:hypothetical protein
MNQHSSRFQWRAFISVLVTLGFMMLALSGVVLFLAPPGRVANWTNWTMLGLRKSDWGGLHIWFGTLFLALTAFHVFFNWRTLVSYFRNRVTRTLGFRKEWAVAAAVCTLIFAGTRAGVVPFSSLIAWNENLKESWDRPAERAPIPHAELLTLAALAEKGGVDLAVASSRLAARGVSGFSADTIVQTIADQAKLSAREIYDIILAGQTGATAHADGRLGGGPGWKTLAQLCSDEGIALEAAHARLAAKGIRFDDTQTLREIAANNEEKPYALVELIRSGSTTR